MAVEKRKYKRVPANYTLCCREIGKVSDLVHHGRTVNASPGGLYFRTNSSSLAEGTLVELELAVPPKSGRLEKPGKVTGRATVIRTDQLQRENSDPTQTMLGVAVEFCDKPKLNNL